MSGFAVVYRDDYLASQGGAGGGGPGGGGYGSDNYSIAFIGAPLFLVGIAAAASLVPTRRAMQLDPMNTLRYE